MATTLTAASVERLKPDPARRLELPDAALPGLYLVIQTSGQKSWAVRYRHGGKPRKATLGRYPAVDLAKARARGREALQLVGLGRDPGAENIEARRKLADGDGADLSIVGNALDSFTTRHVKPNTSRRTAEEAERTFKLHVRPHWEKRRLEEIKRRDVVQLLDRLIDASKPAAAVRALAVIRKFFNWCVERSLIEISPCHGVKPPAEVKSRDRVLSDDELRLVWLAAEKLGGPFGSFVQVLILTAQRRDEVARMTRPEIGRDLWTIPGSRTKNGIAQDVPIAPAVRKVLDAVPAIAGKAGYVFTTSGEAAISGFAKGKSRLDGEMLAIARKEATERGDDPEAVTIEPWRLHDLRRTAATGMAKGGVSVHVIEAVLNHVSGQISGVAAVYNRHRYSDEKRAALEDWAGHVERKVVGRE